MLRFTYWLLKCVILNLYGMLRFTFLRYVKVYLSEMCNCLPFSDDKDYLFQMLMFTFLKYVKVNLSEMCYSLPSQFMRC